MQQICHQLRSEGDMSSFDEISQVVPWIELALDQGQDLESPQFRNDAGLPRLFKTHAWENHCPSFPKTIVVMRHPYDVLVSFYHFFEDWFFESGTVSLEAFAREFWLARGEPQSKMENASYFHHLISWYKRRNDKTVLFVFYEDMKENVAQQVSRVATFLSTKEYNFEKSISIAIANSSFEFMKSQGSKFDEKLSKSTRNEACGLAKTAGMHKTKLRIGCSGSTLTSDLKEQIDRKWMEIVTPITHCDNYDEFRSSFIR